MLLLKYFKVYLIFRSVTEPQDKFLVPLERTITKIKDWNKNAVSHLIIPIKDLEFLMISWRKSSHQWTKIESRIHNHLEQGRDKNNKTIYRQVQNFTHFISKVLQSTYLIDRVLSGARMKFNTSILGTFFVCSTPWD